MGGSVSGLIRPKQSATEHLGASRCRTARSDKAERSLSSLLCTCVCPPASIAVFTKIGGYYEYDVASALGGSGLTNDNRAFGAVKIAENIYIGFCRSS
jgi:hypothetical protein